MSCPVLRRFWYRDIPWYRLWRHSYLRHKLFAELHSKNAASGCWQTAERRADMQCSCSAAHTHLVEFQGSKLMAYTCPLLLPVMCGAVFVLSNFCLMADKFCCVFWAHFSLFCVSCQNSFANSYSHVSVTNLCRCWCEKFWLEHFASERP